MELLPGGNKTTKCDACVLHKGMNFVPALGNIYTARIVLIGEGPGDVEDRKQTPFVGPAGLCLQDLLGELNFSIEDLYITNTVKHRPPGNRTPTTEEINICAQHFLRKEIEIARVRNLPIVTLGSTASKTVARLLQSTIPNTKWQGHKVLDNVIATWHPSYIIRNGNYTDPTSKAYELYSNVKDDILTVWRNNDR